MTPDTLPRTLPPYGQPTYITALVLALAAGAALTWWRWRRDVPSSALADLAVLALGLGGLLARAQAVWLWAGVFPWGAAPAALARALLDLRVGGLAWHGALLGLWLAVMLWAARHRWPWQARARLLDALAPLLALMLVGGWAGCAPVGCGAGREVPTLAGTPALLVTERLDLYGQAAPRWRTQAFGVWGGAALLVLLGTWALADDTRTSGARWSATLLLAGLLMAGLSWLRGDLPPLATWFGLPPTRALDLAFAAWGAVGLWHSVRRARPRPNPAP